MLSDLAVRLKLASWIYEQNIFGITPTINSDVARDAVTLRRPDTKRRAELYLRQMIRGSNDRLSGPIQMWDPLLRIASWSTSDADAVALGEYWNAKGVLGKTNSPQHAVITANTHMIYEAMVGQRATSSQAFVAMSFAPDLNIAYSEGIAPAIINAGYEPLRVDRKEHEGKIDDVIIAEIRRSAFVVADLTGHRGGVYYEAGFAHGLDRKVIFICQEDHLKDTHFDIRQYNILKWSDPPSIAPQLQNRILAIFGAGPNNPNARPFV
jgi:hypothetical protein